MKIEAYKRTRIKKELLKAKEMLEEIKEEKNTKFEEKTQIKSQNSEKPKQKRLDLLTCVELKKEILDLHDKKEGN